MMVVLGRLIQAPDSVPEDPIALPWMQTIQMLLLKLHPTQTVTTAQTLEHLIAVLLATVKVDAGAVMHAAAASVCSLTTEVTFATIHN